MPTCSACGAWWESTTAGDTHVCLALAATQVSVPFCIDGEVVIPRARYDALLKVAEAARHWRIARGMGTDRNRLLAAKELIDALDALDKA